MNKLAAILLFVFVFNFCFAVNSSKEKVYIIALVPGQSTIVLEEEGKKLEKYLNQNTKYKFKVVVPTSYIAVVEALGSKRADIAFINTYGYYLANKKYGVEARLTGELNGTTSYRGQILVRQDGPKTLNDLNGKKMAFVDPASSSGFILPSALLEKEKIKIGNHVFAGKHDSAIIMLYQGQVDAAATYYSPEENGEPQDARKLVKTLFPDVYEKIKILSLTDSIPNDPVVFRKDLPENFKSDIVNQLKVYSKTNEGKVSLKKMYNMSSFVDADKSKYKEISKFYDKRRTEN